MSKWIKGNDGRYYNLNDIKYIEWRKNGSAVGSSYELRAENSTGTPILCTCDTEADKLTVINSLENFLASDDHYLALPKF